MASELVCKLQSSNEEIRLRALDNILQKLKYGVIKPNELAENTECFNIILNLFVNQMEDREVVTRSTIPNLKNVLFVLNLLMKSSLNGRQILINLNAKAILREWMKKYGAYQPCSVKETLEEIIEQLDERVIDTPSSETSLPSTYESVKKKSIENTDPGAFIDQRNMSLPPRLLTGTAEKRVYSPVTRSYIKRVTFSQDLDDADDADEDDLEISLGHSPFDWHPLTKLDRDKINLLHSTLTSYRPEAIRDACIQLRGETLSDFPSEIFIQRPDIVFALQDILSGNTNQALIALAAQALASICNHLQNRWKICKKVKSSRKDQLLLMNDFQVDQTNDSIDIEEDSFADQINTTQLKKLQLQPSEFCLMCLSSAACSLQMVTSLRSSTANIELFESALDFSTSLLNIRAMKNRHDSIHEISETLHRVLETHNSLENRVYYLMALRVSLRFVKTFSVENSHLSTYLQQCAYDPTLYLSHLHLHSLINLPSDFEIVEKDMIAMKYAIRVLHSESSLPSLNDLRMALPTLKFHQNFRKYISIVFQTIRLVRCREKIQIASSILVQLLKYDDSQVRSETLFHLHGVIQDILGVGQALDLDGSKLQDLSFFILDHGKILNELTKMILCEKSSSSVRKAGVEIMIYLLKSEHLWTRKSWDMVIEEVIRPHMVDIEACASLASEAGLTTSLLSWIKDQYSDSKDVLRMSLEGNFRILLSSKIICLRQEALCNLRTYLSREPRSSIKLPRFADMIKIDLVEFLDNLQERNCLFSSLNAISEPFDMKDIIDVLHLSPDFDVVSRKSALLQLSAILHEDTCQRNFLDLNGFEVLFNLFTKCLEETRIDWKELLPYLLEVLKSMANVFHQLVTENDVKDDFLVALLRTMFVFCDQPEVLQDILGLSLLLLFPKDAIVTHSGLSMTQDLLQHIDIPIKVSQRTECQSEMPYTANEAAWPLLKSYWNLAWYGGIHVLSQWEKVKTEPSFSPQLHLTTESLGMIQASFSEAVLEDLCLTLSRSKSHRDWQEKLELANSHFYLLRKGSKESWIYTLPWKDQFSRFMLLKPKTRNDEKLFLNILDFLKKFSGSDEFQKDVEDLIHEGKDNMMEILSRQHPDRGEDLLSRGHQSVSEFLLSFRFIFKNLGSDWDRSLWLSDLNYGSLRVILSAYGCINEDFVNKNALKSLQYLIDSQKTTSFSDSGKVELGWRIILSYFCKSPSMTLSQDWCPILDRALKHRKATIRISAFQVVAFMSSSESGAKFLLRNNPMKIWTNLMEIILDKIECYQVKQFAMTAVTNFLRLSTRKDSTWFGPVVEERISQIKLTGEASLLPFLTMMQWEESICRCFRAFSSHYGASSKGQNSLEESVRQSSLTSSLMSHHETFDQIPTANFLTSVIDFMSQIILLDTASEEIGRRFWSLPLLETLTFPMVINLVFEVREDLHKEMEKLFNSICRFTTYILMNYDWALKSLLEEDRCLSLSILISSYSAHAWNPTRLFEVLQILFHKNRMDDDCRLDILVDKYNLAFLDMTIAAQEEGGFVSAFFQYLQRRNLTVDEWDSLLAQAMAKKYIKNYSVDPYPLIHLLLISTVAQQLLLEEGNLLLQAVEGFDKINRQTINAILLLNNFAMKNHPGQVFLAEGLTLHRKLVPLMTNLCSRFIIANTEVKRDLSLLICHAISLMTTWAAHCTEAKSVFSVNIGSIEGRKTSTNLIQILIDIINNDSLGDFPIRQKIWIPKAFRLIMASLSSVECRSLAIRIPKFLNGRCLRDLDQTNPVISLQVLWLDLLYSLTYYTEGQCWLAKAKDLVNVLVEKALHQNCLTSLAILRNMTFQRGRTQLLLLPNYLTLLQQALEPNPECPPKQRLALTSIWALAANSHKAKVAFQASGLTQSLQELCQKENDKSNSDYQLKCRVLSIVVS